MISRFSINLRSMRAKSRVRNELDLESEDENGILDRARDAAARMLPDFSMPDFSSNDFESA